MVANIFDDNPEVKIEFSLNFDFPSRYIVKSITVSPSVDRIILTSNDNSDESLNLIEAVAIKFCTILSHTPIVATGINFGYIERQNKDNLLLLMNFSDNDNITDLGWGISNQTIKRTFTKDGYFVNMTITLDNASDFVFDFNYHYITLDAAMVSSSLFGKVIDYKNQAVDLLNKLFNLEIEQNV